MKTSTKGRARGGGRGIGPGRGAEAGGGLADRVRQHRKPVGVRGR